MVSLIRIASGDMTHLSQQIRGIANMFGVYQTYYQSDILTNHTASQISWVGSLQGALLFFASVVTGPFFDMGYLRTLLVSGTFLVVFGLMMTSICKTYWQVLLAQGVTVGLGFGCLFLPSVAIVSQYFTTKKAFASGVASTGSSIGQRIMLMHVFSTHPSFRGHSIPNHFSPTATTCWLWVGHSHNSVYLAGYNACSSSRYAAENPFRNHPPGLP